MTSILITVLAVLIVIWYESLKTRELVIGRCRQVCAEANVQLLDQTVAVIAVRIRFAGSALPRLHRIYQFEYSEKGVDRLPGFVDLINNNIINIRFTGPDGGTIYHH